MGRRKQRRPQKVAEEDSEGESQSADPSRNPQTRTGRRKRKTKRGNTSGREGHLTRLSVQTGQEAPTHIKEERPEQFLSGTNNEPDDRLDSGTEADSEGNSEEKMYAYFGGVVYPGAWNSHWPQSQVGRRFPVGQDVRVKQEPRSTDDWKYGQYTAHISSYPIPSSNMVRDMQRLQYNMLPGRVSVMACQAEPPPTTDPPRPWSLALTATANRMALHDSNPNSQQTSRVSLGWGFPTNLPHAAMHMYRNNLVSTGSASEGHKESATHRVSPLRIEEVTDEKLSTPDNGQRRCSSNASPVTECKDSSTAVVHIPPFASAVKYQPVPIKETEDTFHEDAMEETPLDLSQSSSLNGSQNTEIGDGEETNSAETEMASLSPYIFSPKMHTKYSYYETDEGEKVFNCPECNKVIKNHVARHLKTHTGEKKYRCRMCPYSTARKDNLQQHMATRYHREVLGESPTSYFDMLKKYPFLINTAEGRDLEETADETGCVDDNRSRTYAPEPVAMEVEVPSEDGETGNRQSRERETQPGDQTAADNLSHSSTEVSSATTCTEPRIGTLQQLRRFLLGHSSTVKIEEGTEHQSEEHRQEEKTDATGPSDPIQPYQPDVKDAAKVPINDEPTTLTVNNITNFSSLNFPKFTMETSDTSSTGSREDGSSSSTSEETTEFLKAAEVFALCKSEEGGLPVFRCTLCNKSFPRKQSWNRHMKLHVGNRKYKCELCPYSAKAKRTLEQHMAVHKLKPSNPIELMKFISPKQGSEADQLQTDPASIVDVVEENGTSTKHYHFQCQVCQFASTSSLKFSGHMHLYHEREQWKFQVQCNFCKSTSKTEDDIKQHLFKNHGIRQKPLDRFTLAQEVMSDPEQFSCTLCNFVTKMKAKFEAHLLVHYTAKMYQCKKCHKYFKTTQELSEHLATMHVDTRHNCDKCSYGTNLMSALKAHMLTHGKEEFKCRICQHTTDTKLGLKMHVSQQHRYGNLYRCNTCGYLGKTANKLIDHIRTHTKEKPFSCKLCKYACSRQDNLAIHMRVHKKDTVYDCPKCDFLTLSVAEIEAHHKTHTWSRTATKIAMKHLKYVGKKEPNMQINYVEPDKKEPTLIKNTNYDTDAKEPLLTKSTSYVGTDMKESNMQINYAEPDKKEPIQIKTGYETDKKETKMQINNVAPNKNKSNMQIKNTSYATIMKEPMQINYVEPDRKEPSMLIKHTNYVDTDKKEPNMLMKHTSHVDTDKKEPNMLMKHTSHVDTEKKEPNMQMKHTSHAETDMEKKEPNMLMKHTSHAETDTDKKEPNMLMKHTSHAETDTDKKEPNMQIEHTNCVDTDIDKKEPKMQMKHTSHAETDTEKKEPNMQIEHTNYVDTDTDKKEPMQVEEVETEISAATAQPGQQPC
ncbi:zinc finger protein 658B-like [Branchiostoma lanceolatum]|uniref:zinc finger protein 658B-like n=1 Tax=Branchiostoma lanceolatum TaxID=7740 RepID=UPI0034519545